MTFKSCAVVDYGLGNVYSVMRAIEQLEGSATLTADPDEIAAADRVILPGVGAFGGAAERLRELRLEEPILQFANSGRPFLGICVGMQLLMELGTEFGEHRGFGLIGGSVNRMDLTDSEGGKARIPLIGWHPLQPPAEKGYDLWADTPLDGVEGDNAFYFVHSFAAQLTDPADALAVTNHGGHEVIAAVRRDNVIGTQFHPERSSTFGLNFLEKFLTQ